MAQGSRARGGWGRAFSQVRILLAADGLTFLGTDPTRHFRLGDGAAGPTPVAPDEVPLLAAGVPARLIPAVLAAVRPSSVQLQGRP